jgi:hypothetical protein
MEELTRKIRELEVTNDGLEKEVEVANAKYASTKKELEDTLAELGDI